MPGRALLQFSSAESAASNPSALKNAAALGFDSLSSLSDKSIHLQGVSVGRDLILFSGNNFKCRDPVAFKLEKESKVNWTAGKVADKMAGHNDLPVLLFAPERLTGVLIL